LKRGFAIVKQETRLVKRLSDLDREIEISLQFYDGEVKINNDRKKE
jgi:exonuclease VII large subunit